MSIVGAFMVPHPPLIIPAVGKGGEKQIEKTTESYMKVAEKIAELEPETIIISSPHTTCYSDYFHISPGAKASGSFAMFGAPNTKFEEEYDEEFVNELESLAQEKNVRAGTEGEQNPSLDHGTMVPLYFIRQKYNNFKIVRIGISGLPLVDHYKVGEHKLQPDGPYGFDPNGPIYDEKIMDVCGKANFKELFDFPDSLLEKASECGHPSFTMMAGALDGIDVETTKLSHEDVTGVGYGLCYFIPTGPNEKRHFLEQYLEELNAKKAKEEHDEYVKLAIATVNEYIKNKEYLKVPENLPKEMLEDRAGVFVSIHKFDKLRGCIGTFLPVQDCIAKEIVNNAISASIHDPRFSPITEDELPYLDINVDVLSTPEDISSKDELDVKRYGVIVSSGFKRGLLLPDLDGIDDVDTQVSIAMQKGDIKEGEPIKLQRFEVVRHR